MSFKDKLLDDLVDAYHKARPGKRKSVNENRFETCAIENIVILRDMIISRKYEPGNSVAFEIEDPKVREIFAADFADRVVHHYVFAKTMPWWEKHLSYESYSCRVGKGTLHAQKRLAHHIQSASENYQKPTWNLKLDIESYFTSIDKNILLELVLDGLKKQFPNRGELYRTLKYLWTKIIMDDAVSKMIVRDSMDKLNRVPKHKSLRYQPPDIGLVIGNLTSQAASNIYLNQLDRFIQFDLGLKHFVRYVDDIAIVLNEEQKGRAKEIIEEIDIFLCNNLHLKLNQQKTYLQEIHKGVEFLGAVVYPGYIVPGRRLKKNCAKNFKMVSEGCKGVESVAGTLGLFANINGQKSLEKIFDRNGWDY